MHVISRNKIRNILYSKIEVIPWVRWGLHICSISQYFKRGNVVGIKTLYFFFFITFLTFFYMVRIFLELWLLLSTKNSLEKHPFWPLKDFFRTDWIVNLSLYCCRFVPIGEMMSRGDISEQAYAVKEMLNITLLSSEWKSSAGGLSTLNRELAIIFIWHRYKMWEFHCWSLRVLVTMKTKRWRKVLASVFLMQRNVLLMNLSFGWATHLRITK